MTQTDGDGLVMPANNISAIQTASRIVMRGGLIVFPTDTVYGLGCDPFNAEAVRRLVQAKKRQRGSLPVLVDNLESAKQLGIFDSTAERLSAAFWPGPLTLVLPASRPMPSEVIANGFIGLRIPNREDTLALIRECNGRLVGTSANITGHPSSKTAQEAVNQLDENVDLFLDGGPASIGIESTVIQLSEGRASIIREAAVSKERILSQCGTIVFG